MRWNPSIVASNADTQTTPLAIERMRRTSGSMLSGNKLTMIMKNASEEIRSDFRLHASRTSRQINQRNMIQCGDFMRPARCAETHPGRGPDPDVLQPLPFRRAKGVLQSAGAPFAHRRDPEM